MIPDMFLGRSVQAWIDLSTVLDAFGVDNANQLRDLITSNGAAILEERASRLKAEATLERVKQALERK